MDSLKNRFFIRFTSSEQVNGGGQNAQTLPLAKKRTVMMLFFQFMLGQFEYLEIYNEAYLGKKTFHKEVIDGISTRGKSKSLRQTFRDSQYESQVTKFQEGLYDPETKEGYQLTNQTIKPMDEEMLDNPMSLIEYITDGTI